MNLHEFMKLAKPVVGQPLNEHAGSEGMEYKALAKSGLKTFSNDEFVMEDVKSENGTQTAKVVFDYPHDYGFALNVISETLGNVEDLKLELIF